MKRRLILAVAAALAVLLSSCRKADEVTSTESQFDELEFTATIDGPSTKTTVNTDGSDTKNRGKIEWVKGDTITIKDVTKDVSVRYVAAGNGATSTFRKASGQSVRLGSGPYTATYGTEPAKIQNYADHHSEVANQAKNVYMEVPESKTRSLTFTAACGLLKLALTADKGVDESVTKIEVTGTLKDETEPVTYTLNCVDEKGNAVSIASVTDFYLTLPAGSYNKMVFTNAKNVKDTYPKSESHVMEIVNNRIQPMTIDNLFSPLLSGEFSVSDRKKVKFTKGNLYWDGSSWHFESSQTEYPTSWNTKHVGHFYWSKTASVAYAYTYNASAEAISDSFFCGEANKLTVDGHGDLYALSKDEWAYLLGTSNKRNGKHKYAVTVSGVRNCLVIAPDVCLKEYTFDNAKVEYTAEEWATAEAAGLVCLPSAGYRSTSMVYYGALYGGYWSSTPYEYGKEYAYRMYLDKDKKDVSHNDYRRDIGNSVRLVSSK